MRQFMALSKALADESRVRALLSLRQGELCACQIIELLGLAPSTVSRHMSLLVQAGLVQRRKDGRWHYYQFARADSSGLIRQTQRWVLAALKDEPVIIAEAKRLASIKKRRREDLCACYKS